MIILNTQIINTERLIQLWNRATLRVLVDGAANNWKQLVGEKGKYIIDPIPNLVTGDFDSISPEVRSYYEEVVPNCKVVHTPDQNFTDFTKALYEVRKEIDSFQGIEKIYAFSEHSGRLDQIFALFETLFHARTIENLPPVQIVSSDSIDWLLDPGKHIIDLQCTEVTYIQ